jgi:hypothetical protein
LAIAFGYGLKVDGRIRRGLREWFSSHLEAAKRTTLRETDVKETGLLNIVRLLTEARNIIPSR